MEMRLKLRCPWFPESKVKTREERRVGVKEVGGGQNSYSCNEVGLCTCLATCSFLCIFLLGYTEREKDIYYFRKIGR